MRWLKRALIALLILAVLGFVAVVLFMRANLDRADSPEKVGETGVVRERNFYVDLYGVKTSSSVLVFDAAVDQSGAALDRLLEGMGVKREDVTDVFLTHAHPDHYASTLLMPKARVHGGQKDVAWFAGQSHASGLLIGIMYAIMPTSPIVSISDPLEGEREVPIDGGKETILAIPFPGHTPGSYVFLFRDVLIAGDGFNYNTGKLVETPTPFNNDPIEAQRSIATLPAIYAKHTVNTICTGHGGCTPPGKVRELTKELLLTFQETMHGD